MLRNIKDLHGYKLKAKDGMIGSADEFYFDDHSWTIRYLVANTGSWLVDNKVLISPHSINKPFLENKIIPIDLTKEQIEKSPKINNDKPVSRQHEVSIAEYYNWPYYWAGLNSPMVGTVHPVNLESFKKSEKEMQAVEEKDEDPNLRSTNEVEGYYIKAEDGNIGHVEDFLFDDENWEIRYLVVDTRNFLPGGRKVIIALSWINDINWIESNVSIDLTKEQIKNSPEYDPLIPTERKYENKLHEFYQKKKYWE